MAKKALYEAAWILGLIGGIICILFAVLNGIGQTAEILFGKSILKGLTGIANAAILGILGFLIIGTARITRAGGQKAITGGIFLLIFGVVAYLVGSEIGAAITVLTGILALIAKST